jgi:uracil-DNA glycosylase family 4
MDLDQLNQTIINCTKCERLATYIKDVGKRKVKRFSNWEYWSKPVPSFGDPQAKIVIVGLAPAAHGGNRTGRMFTGDHSGEWLFRALHEVGLANKPTSLSREDGLESKVYITAVLHCAPPNNKPTPEEVRNCSSYLRQELAYLKNAKVIVTLGKLAFDEVCRIFEVRGKFSHGIKLKSSDGKIIIASYHPSARNTNTGKMSWEQWVTVFKEALYLSENQGTIP